MLFVKRGFKFILVSVFVASLTLTGCSFMPWSDDKDDEDLFFEEDFGSEFESDLKDVPAADKEKEDDFFKDDKQLAQPKPGEKPQAQDVPVSPDEEDFFFEDDEKLTQSKSNAEPKPRPAPQVSPKENDDFFFEDEPMARRLLANPHKNLDPSRQKKLNKEVV